MKILIGDNSGMREMMKVHLSELTEEFRECDDGVKALSYYTDFHPDWVFVDWEMKEMDGLSATREIVSNFPEAQILLVTPMTTANCANPPPPKPEPSDSF